MQTVIKRLNNFMGLSSRYTRWTKWLSTKPTNFSGMGYAPASGWAMVRLLPIRLAEDGQDTFVVEKFPEDSLA
jgi:hypothetical protein